MNRRDFITATAGALAATSLSSRASAAPSRPEVRPNIVLFVTDDHGAWALEGLRNREIRAPNLALLAREGAMFTNAFTPCPVCSPARACLATGLTPSQHGLHDYLGPGDSEANRRDWLGHVPTLYELFHDAGYATAIIGKHHLGGSLKGVDAIFEHGGGPAHYGKVGYVENGRKTEYTGTRSDGETDRAAKFIGQAKAAGQPFFLHVGYTQTHSPYLTKEHDPAVVALFEKATLADLPAYRPHPWARNEGMPSDGPLPPELVADARRGYYAAVVELDRSFARLRAALQEHGCADNTTIIYTSDHGCAIGHNGIWGKGNSTRPLNMFETSLRVPLIVHDPRAPGGGRRIEQAVTHYDTFQALLEFGGIACPNNGQAYPGHSWRPLLGGGAVTWDDTTYGEYGDLRMIRTSRWKFVERYPRGPYELFDLVNDPGEEWNVAGADFTRGIQDELTGRLHEWYARHEDPKYSGLRVKELPMHNPREAWRDGIRERRGLQAG